MHLLLDRSGSVSADPGASSGQVALAEAFSGLDWSPTAVAVSGYDDDGTGTTIYEIKPFDLHHDRALYELPRIGGGGTPTGGAITKVTKDWRKYDYDRSLEAKLLVVVTDGTANDVVACRQAVDRALDSGIRVVAAFKATDNLEQEQEAMDAQFGRNWFAVEEYTDVPAALVRFLKRDGDIVDAASTPSPEVQEIGDSVLALSDSAARQFVAAHKSSSDFSLQLAALYVNVRLTDPDASPETALAAARGYQAGATLPANF